MQVFGAVQEPLPLQTKLLKSGNPLQTKLKQLLPVYPGKQLQLFGDAQVPFPLHTFPDVDAKPLQMGLVQYDPVHSIELEVRGVVVCVLLTHADK